MERHKKKKVNWGFSKLEYKLMEQYLEEMAMKGWIPEVINENKAWFIPTRPRKLKFCVDIASFVEIDSNDDGDDNENENELFLKYKDSCEKLGWHFITSYDKMQFFYADEYENSGHIQTDLELEQKLVVEKVWKKEIYSTIYSFINFAMILWLLFISRENFYYSLLTDWRMIFTFLFILIFMPIRFIYSSITIINNLKWCTKAKLHMKNGIEIKQNSLKKVKLRNYMLNLSEDIYLLVLIIMLSRIWFSRGIFYNWTVRLPLLLATIVFIIFSCIYYIKHKGKISKKVQIRLMCGFFIGITILLYMMARQSLNGKSYNIHIVPEKYSVLKISDFSDIELKDGENFNPLLPFGYENYENDITKNYSPLVPVNYEYYEYYKNDDKNIYYTVNTSYYKCLNESIASIIYESILDKYRNKEYYKKNMKSVSAEIWNCDKASLVSGETLILLKGKEVIKIYISEDLVNVFDDKFKELIFEKFTKNN